MGVEVRRPGMEGAGAVRKLVAVPVALRGRGTAVPPDRTPALDAVSYRRPVAVPVAVPEIVPVAVSYRPKLSIELMLGKLSTRGSAGKGRAGELLMLLSSSVGARDWIVLGTPKLISLGAPREGKKGTSN